MVIVQVSEEDRLKEIKYNEVTNDVFSFLDDKGIKISTITITAKLNSGIDLRIFSMHVPLHVDGIMSVKYGNKIDTTTNRSISDIEKHTKKVSKTKKKRNFINQATVRIYPDRSTNNCINVKIFRNGSIQLTGCKCMEDCYDVIDKLIMIMMTPIIVNDDKIVFLEEPSQLHLSDVCIRMINSNFKLNYRVDKDKLYSILRTNHHMSTHNKEIGYVECKYNPLHACVNIKHLYKPVNDDPDAVVHKSKSHPHKISIFVFQTGSIIITGAKNMHHVISSYKYINKILEKYFNQVRVIVIDREKIISDYNEYLTLKKNGKLPDKKNAIKQNPKNDTRNIKINFC